jgi:hypothetical protein
LGVRCAFAFNPFTSKHFWERSPFFYDLSDGLQDLELHLLPTQEPLEFADPLVRIPQLAAGITSSLAVTAVEAPASYRRSRSG